MGISSPVLIAGSSAGTGITPTLTSSDIQASQDSYASGKGGAYLQVLPGNKLPDYETGTVASNLGGDIDASTTINVYEGPKGKGYQIITEDATSVTAMGYGPQADDFTYTIIKSTFVSSTSTPSK